MKELYPVLKERSWMPFSDLEKKFGESIDKITFFGLIHFYEGLFSSLKSKKGTDLEKFILNYIANNFSIKSKEIMVCRHNPDLMYFISQLINIQKFPLNGLLLLEYWVVKGDNLEETLISG